MCFKTMFMFIGNKQTPRQTPQSPKKCDLRRLVQKCNFFCSTLLYGVLFNIF